MFRKTGDDNPFNGIDVGDFSAPAFADINGDDEIDMVLGAKNGLLIYYLNESTDSDTVFTEQTKSYNPFNNIDVGTRSRPTFADINGDGKKDLVVGEHQRKLYYFLNESTQDAITFTPKIIEMKVPLAQTESPSRVTSCSNICRYRCRHSDLDLITGVYEGGETLNYYR